MIKLGNNHHQSGDAQCDEQTADDTAAGDDAGHQFKVDEKTIEDLGAKVSYAAVGLEDDEIHLSGSRALGIVASGDSIEEAEKLAEKACACIKGNVYHRSDVGTTDLVNKRVEHMKEILN